MWAPRSDHRLLIPTVGALIALAWAILWAWSESPYARFLSHDELAEASAAGLPLLALAFVAGWTLMVVAMMLPTSLPLVAVFRTVVRERPHRGRLVATLIAGYLGVWALFGTTAYRADGGLHELVGRIGWIEANAWVIGSGTLLVAGVYQFTPLKYRCLDKCRSPLSFINHHWRGGNERIQAFRLGVDHGLFCLGCCWSLMLLMFAVGAGNLGWMVVLGTLMGAEKNAPWGRRLSRPVGAALIASGLAMAVIAPEGAALG